MRTLEYSSDFRSFDCYCFFLSFLSVFSHTPSLGFYVLNFFYSIQCCWLLFFRSSHIFGHNTSVERWCFVPPPTKCKGSGIFVYKKRLSIELFFSIEFKDKCLTLWHWGGKVRWAWNFYGFEIESHKNQERILGFLWIYISFIDFQ